MVCNDECRKSNVEERTNGECRKQNAECLTAKRYFSVTPIFGQSDSKGHSSHFGLRAVQQRRP